MTARSRIAAFRRGATLAGVALALGVCLVVSARADEQRFALDGPLVLTDADGEAVTSDDFPGKWLLIYFGYGHCADQCPTALSAIVEALDEIGPAADKIQPLFVTVDPERDRGPALREFTAAFDKRIVGLTGTPEQIAAAARALGVKYEKVLEGSDDYVIDHVDLEQLTSANQVARHLDISLRGLSFSARMIMQEQYC